MARPPACPSSVPPLISFLTPKEQDDLFVRCRMGIFSLEEIAQQAGALERRYGAIGWRLIHLLETMPDILCESIPVERSGAPWQSVGGSGSPLGEMDHATTLQYQRVLRERLERNGGRDFAMDAEARRRRDFPEELPDGEDTAPSFDTPPPKERCEKEAAVAQVHAKDRCYQWGSDKLLPSFHIRASFDHLELPHAQCAFTAAQVELYHLSRRMTRDQFVREAGIL